MTIDRAVMIKGASYQLGCEIVTGSVKLAVAGVPLLARATMATGRAAGRVLGAAWNWSMTPSGPEETPKEFRASQDVIDTTMRDLRAQGITPGREPIIRMHPEYQRDQRCLNLMKAERARIEREIGKTPVEMEMVNNNTVMAYV